MCGGMNNAIGLPCCIAVHAIQLWAATCGLAHKPSAFSGSQLLPH